MHQRLLQYARLNRRQAVFRLLKILPSSTKDSVQAELFDTSITEQAGNFTALSYTWGSPVPVSCLIPITVNGCQFRIRENLFNYLQRRVRHRDYGLFWVDAICINQDDVADRNHQVGIMSEIYRSANKVSVWLGEPSDELAMQVLDKSRIQQAFSWVKEEPPKPSSLVTAFALVGTQSLLTNPYWKRLWVVQEVTLAKEIEICCGDSQFVWGSLQQMDRLLQDKLNTPTFDESFDLWQHRCWNIEMNLAYLIDRFGTNHCQNHYDRIYALMGILSASTGQQFPCDYEEPPDQLLARVVTYCQNPIASFVELLAIYLHVRGSIEDYPCVLEAFENVCQAYINRRVQGYRVREHDPVQYDDEEDIRVRVYTGCLNVVRDHEVIGYKMDELGHDRNLPKFRRPENLDPMPFMRNWLLRNRKTFSHYYWNNPHQTPSGRALRAEKGSYPPDMALETERTLGLIPPTPQPTSPESEIKRVSVIVDVEIAHYLYGWRPHEERYPAWQRYKKLNYPWAFERNFKRKKIRTGTYPNGSK